MVFGDGLTHKVIALLVGQRLHLVMNIHGILFLGRKCIIGAMSAAGLVVPAILALALVCAGHVPLEALAVLLLAKAILAFATLEVLVLRHLLFKGLNITLQDVPDGIAPLFLVLLVVVADVLRGLWLVAAAGGAAGGLVSEALAVQLKALGIFALAAHALLHPRLLLSYFSKKLVLGHCLS